jgi:hypothetical protein
MGAAAKGDELHAVMWRLVGYSVAVRPRHLVALWRYTVASAVLKQSSLDVSIALSESRQFFLAAVRPEKRDGYVDLERLQFIRSVVVGPCFSLNWF